MRVTPDAGLRDDYDLKLNSYDLGVDIELHDVVQRLRFEHPEVRAVVVTGGLDKVFCAGANIQMLSGSTHAHKVAFCKFTNETRNSIEDATANSGQVWIAAVNGTAAGGGYELALACDEIVLVDDRSSAVSLPEVPLLAVLPGTGGLTRLVDKRFVRRDLADVFATRAEGVKGQQALDWGLVDAIAPRSRFDDVVRERAAGPCRRFPPAGGRAAASRSARSPRTSAPTRCATPRRRRHRPGARRRPHHGARPDRGAGHVARRPRRRPPGSSPPPASSTTRSCGCASTSPRSARGCSTRAGTPARSPRPRTCSGRTPTTGSSTRRACLDPCPQAPRPVLPHARRPRRAGERRARLLAELVLAADRSFMLDGPDPTSTRRRPRCASPPRTTAGSRCPTGSAGWPRASSAAPPRSTAARAAVGKDLLGGGGARRRARHGHARRHRLGRRHPPACSRSATASRRTP